MSGPFTPAEEAALRRLVYQAFGVRGNPRKLRKALGRIEDWQWRTAPERLARQARSGR
jgi:hypothetical protein